jgi:Smg protein
MAKQSEDEELLDMLMQLCEHSKLSEAQIELDYDELLPELVGQGFDQSTVLSALDWIHDLVVELDEEEPRTTGIRVFSTEECAVMDADARNCLIKLENMGILNPVTRERVIEQVMGLRKAGLGNSLVRWVAYLVLSTHPGHETALERMELFVADTFSGGVQ